MKRSTQRDEGPDYDADLRWWLLPVLAITLVLTGAVLWQPSPTLLAAARDAAAVSTEVPADSAVAPESPSPAPVTHEADTDEAPEESYSGG
jgi:hypothetical protein